MKPTGKLGLVYETLCHAAENGLPAPIGSQLCELIGAKSVSSAAKYIRDLEDCGYIVVEKGKRRGRVVTILKTGKKTFDGKKGTVHVPPRVSPADLNPNMCRWPYGDPQEKTFGFCGEPAESHTPYCAEHISRAYRATSDRHKQVAPFPYLTTSMNGTKNSPRTKFRPASGLSEKTPR